MMRRSTVFVTIALVLAAGASAFAVWRQTGTRPGRSEPTVGVVHQEAAFGSSVREIASAKRAVVPSAGPAATSPPPISPGLVCQAASDSQHGMLWPLFEPLRRALLPTAAYAQGSHPIHKPAPSPGPTVTRKPASEPPSMAQSTGDVHLRTLNGLR